MDRLARQRKGNNRIFLEGVGRVWAFMMGPFDGPFGFLFFFCLARSEVGAWMGGLDSGRDPLFVKGGGRFPLSSPLAALVEGGAVVWCEGGIVGGRNGAHDRYTRTPHTHPRLPPTGVGFVFVVEWRMLQPWRGI